MELNQNYPWYLQTSPNFTKLYEGMFNVAKNYSPIELYKVFYPTVMVQETDQLAALNGLNMYGSLWQILPSAITVAVGALIYDSGNWSAADKWNGSSSNVSTDWLLRYLNMKAYINQQPFSLSLINGAMDILFGSITYSITVTETQTAITINISTDLISAVVVQGILAADPTLFGKPMGASITFNFS